MLQEGVREDDKPTGWFIRIVYETRRASVSKDGHAPEVVRVGAE
jgi:hypothetical protein